jgi:hypothetical protein
MQKNKAITIDNLNTHVVYLTQGQIRKKLCISPQTAAAAHWAGDIHRRMWLQAHSTVFVAPPCIVLVVEVEVVELVRPCSI